VASTPEAAMIVASAGAVTTVASFQPETTECLVVTNVDAAMAVASCQPETTRCLAVAKDCRWVTEEGRRPSPIAEMARRPQDAQTVSSVVRPPFLEAMANRCLATVAAAAETEGLLPVALVLVESLVSLPSRSDLTAVVEVAPEATRTAATLMERPVCTGAVADSSPWEI